MRVQHREKATLSIRADPAYLRLAVNFVENAALAFGLGKEEALALTLASEELFSYLCEVAAPEKEIHVSCKAGGYYVGLELILEANEFDVGAFNLTSCQASEEECQPIETGVLIASRMVDHFRLYQHGGRIHLILKKEKTYPVSTDTWIPEAPRLQEFSIRTSDVEETKILVRLLNAYGSIQLIPGRFSLPGKVVDMVSCGEYEIRVAVDEVGHIGGGIIWHNLGSLMVEYFGPYLFGDCTESNVAEALVDSCISAIARTKALGLITHHPLSNAPSEYFEFLGSFSVIRDDGQNVEIGASYRCLEEDVGLTVWVHPEVKSFVSAEYERLYFVRKIQMAGYAGESVPPFAAFSAQVERGRIKRATLEPVWWGADATTVLTAHLAAFEKENIFNVFFRMDLGHYWHSFLTPVLLELGFEPRLILPHAGKGDILIFQHKEGESR